MSFKWDWDKRELVEGEGPEEEKEWYDLAFVAALLYWGWWAIEHIFPWLGHIFLGGWL